MNNTLRKQRQRRRGQWFWKFRKDGPPIVAERLADQRWHLYVNNLEIGNCRSREIAERLIDKLLAADRGQR